MTKNLLLKSNIFKIIREVMDKYSFVEVNTPLLRKGTNHIFNRHQVDFSGNHSGNIAYLRDSMECALRSTLQFHDRVFEIGTCFRLDSVSKTHYPEFTLFEVYALKVDMNFLMDVVSEIIQKSFALKGKPCSINKISVQNYFQTSLGIDILQIDGNEIKEKIISSNEVEYSSFKNSPHYEIINKFIEEKIESISGVNILYGYPACTISTARRKNSTHVIERFELFIDGLEICNAYLDETNIADMIKRCEEVGLYNYEEKQIVHLINQNLISSDSGGLGIGIERLCCAITKLNLVEFIAAKEFNFMSLINH